MSLEAENLFQIAHTCQKARTLLSIHLSGNTISMHKSPHGPKEHEEKDGRVIKNIMETNIKHL